MAKTKKILNEYHSDGSVEGREKLRSLIVVVLNGEVAPQVAGQANCTTLATTTQVMSQDVSMCFSEAKESVFSNAHPCLFEFEGKNYPNAMVCFIAQQYTDQPQMMDLLIQCETIEEALTLAELTPMTSQRKLSWENSHAQYLNKEDVMMHVQKAKFDQNPELKAQLLATGRAYLVCQGNDHYFSDNFDGTGQNNLGICLMRLRGEYGGVGIVQPCINYQSEIQGLQSRCNLITDQLFSDIIQTIFLQCIDNDHFESIRALSCVNTHWNGYAIDFWRRFDLKQFCPELTILDAQALGIEINDEPHINCLAILKSFKKLALCIEKNAGLTLLTMPKGLTFNQLRKMALLHK